MKPKQDFDKENHKEKTCKNHFKLNLADNIEHVMIILTQKILCEMTGLWQTNSIDETHKQDVQTAPSEYGGQELHTDNTIDPADRLVCICNCFGVMIISFSP